MKTATNVWHGLQKAQRNTNMHMPSTKLAGLHPTHIGKGDLASRIDRAEAMLMFLHTGQGWDQCIVFVYF